MHGPAADAVLTEVVRHQRGRLVALLAARTRDIAAAEDVVGEAIAQAWVTWRREGVPHNVAGWLLTVARNRWLDAARHAQVQAAFAADPLHQCEALVAGLGTDTLGEFDFADERLKLMFVCAHPAIDRAVHTPLMLQVVLGVPVDRMAGIFLVGPGALGQRLSRAKSKIRDAGVAFEVPVPGELAARLPAVLDAIYGAYGLGWEAVQADAVSCASGLADEALSLGRLLAELFPDPEVLGLLALMLFCESRRGARRNAAGDFVPLDEQDVALWDRTMTQEAAATLARASQAGQLGRYQLEAAVQSVHAQRAVTGQTDWSALAHLYQGLLSLAPTVGYQLGFIGVLARWQGPRVAMEHLTAMPLASVREHQPYWALRAHLHQALDERDEAERAYSLALGLTRGAAVQRFLQARWAAVRAR
jgi:RNA polymerase sigma-70 factor (ECF subfamily)